MSKYVLTPIAKADIIDLWTYIAQDSEESANRVEQAIYEACDLLAESPMMGHTRKEFTSRDLLFWTLTRYRNYVLVYSPHTSPLQIVAVVHGRRNLPGVLSQRQ
jgi:plasmid stabilization system protein ParE